MVYSAEGKCGRIKIKLQVFADSAEVAKELLLEEFFQAYGVGSSQVTNVTVD